MGAACDRRFDSHRRWALRLFLVVGGVWFFGIGLLASIVANQCPVGFNPNPFSGPFLSVLSFAQFLLPRTSRWQDASTPPASVAKLWSCAELAHPLV